MSKSIEQVLLIPGEAGWEAWSRQGSEPFAPVLQSACTKVGELDDLPAGEIVIGFPARMVTALPVKVATDDDSLFPDLLTLHAERLGLRADPMAGQLTDWFTISTASESATLLSVFLRTPGDGDLPKRGPKGFDLSARMLPVEGSAVVAWRELGRWVFAIHQDGKLIYLQSTGVEGDSPDVSLAREIQLAMMQIDMQGIAISPRRVLVWSSVDGVETGEFSRVLGLPCEVSPRPLPVLPQPLSRLLPADVRAARRAAQQRRNMIVGVAAAAVLYLGLVGWLGYGLWSTSSETKRLLAAAQQAAPDAAEYTAHVKKWNELSHAIDLRHSPVDILNRVANSIPASSGLRLKSADISAVEIKLIGEAQTLEGVNSFNLRLTKNNELNAFEWQTPEPSQSKRGWEFVFTANTNTP